MKLSWRDVLVLVCCAACRDGLAPGNDRPNVSNVTVAANPTNVLSAIVTCSVGGVDSVRVRFAGSDGDTGATPFARPTAGRARIVLLGLQPSARYSLVVEALGPGGSASLPDSVATAALPSALQSLHLRGTGRPSSSYTLVVPILGDTTSGADGYVVIFDGAGDVRWYRAFPNLWPIEAKQQRNGNLTVYVGRSFGWQPVDGHYEEIAADGAVTRTFATVPPLYTDPHELLLSFADSGGSTLAAVHMLGYELQTFDLSALGGARDALLAAHTIERQNAAGATVFRWRSLDHFDAQDWAAGVPLIPDIDHPSSLALDRDGNYIVSFQGLDEITNIDAVTGAIRWRFGGRHSQFRIIGDPLGGFSGQHHAQMLENGHLLLMDNHIRTRGPARAVEYALDLQAMTATMVWEYRPSPGVVSMSMGSVQRLGSGATLVGFGAAGRVAEVGGGVVTWSATVVADAGGGGTAVPFYRAVGVPSLYGYAPAVRQR
ncbi:MAG: arylsulfotransferase family protein [Gemmatimonas sp.]